MEATMSVENRKPRGPGILPYIARYYELDVKRGAGCSDDEAWLLRRLEEIFVPRRVTPSGFRRQPVGLRLRRKARLWVGQEVYVGETTLIGLQELQLWLTSQPKHAATITLEIEGTVKGLWWRFSGRVLPARRRTGIVTVRLHRFLDCIKRREVSHMAGRVA
jgi:hypothetical protein